MSFRTLSGKLPGGYPMLPFTGISDGELEPYEQLEYQAVAQTRKALIEALPLPRKRKAAASPAAEPTTQALTPQGLLADVGGDGSIANLTLALSPAGAVEMTGVSAALVAALQASQLFLVATDPKSLAATPPLTREVEIPSSPDGTQLWRIEVWPQEWSASATMLVLKFAGKSLVELMADTATWAGHEGVDFNPGKEGVAKAQQTLEAVVARALNSEAPEFKPFADLAQDPSWEGVLFLNAPVPPAALPPEIAGLAAGLDASAFKAHHIGLTVTPASNEGGTVTPKPSSLFGLIFYETLNSAAAGGAPPYSFAVRSLKVRFENSLVKTFASTIELLVDQLFGEPATLVEPHEGELRPRSPSLLLLEGVYQQQGSHGGYTFTSGEADLFSVTSPVLDLVEVSLAQFVTVVAPQPGELTKAAQSRFVLSGSIRFQAPPTGVPDVFSFGPQAGAKEPLSVTQLFYSNLWITLDYVPAERTKDRYTFDASKAIPDATRSVPRGGSLGAGFPLTPTGFVQVAPPEPPAPPAQPPTPATPASLGFLGIGTEPALGSTIKAPWFGLVADLGFGTAGALAAAAGFKASMIFAWAPGDPKVANAGLGLKLPGTGTGAKLLSLQGVLKLKIGQLTLADPKDTGGTYVLELDRIALGVLMLSLPSSGQIRALLFADPTGKDHTTLGWYAGYAKTGGS